MNGDKALAPHMAVFQGTSEVWEYYKAASGAGARRSISKRTIFWRIKLTAQGYVRKIAPSCYRATYDYKIPRGTRNYSFIPSQNLISQEYSLMEVMQWLPPPTHQRKGVGGTFTVNGKTIHQNQVYKNSNLIPTAIKRL